MPTKSLDDCLTGRTVTSPEGVECSIIDVSKLDFGNDDEAAWGKKTRPIKAWIARPGEKVATALAQGTESYYECAGGEVVFENELPHGLKDIYVPRSPTGESTGAALLKRDYLPVDHGLNGEHGCFAPNSKPVKILHEIINRPACIVDCWGPGKHAYFYPGATLKIADGRVTGIDKDAFDFTWSITDREGVILDARRNDTPRDAPRPGPA
ncbi:MAG TPA: hypothetical protein VL625_12535 [Patescibacteria group bacterium]|nr:hypothetical protein [Patescibacteria group bacterium]